ncbi:hypothetical protein HYH03_000380 [Edaphochlamys debaryana]|uniref:RAP domain-containing protein n=1 Tax=Edaphochlamys debaryana TaxID=47281 RepID=A0A836C7K9_9CHLO|nr:hypothetical protein HYH03_000380 [Edaphochlamys debaryana]|eukprot:KAG2501882.1 hypothetical protein HYH03_000380 [Edaphochlamys debaryana]
MSVPSRLRWLLPGHGFAPALALQGRELLQTKGTGGISDSLLAALQHAWPSAASPARQLSTTSAAHPTEHPSADPRPQEQSGPNTSPISTGAGGGGDGGEAGWLRSTSLRQQRRKEAEALRSRLERVRASLVAQAEAEAGTGPVSGSECMNVAGEGAAGAATGPGRSARPEAAAAEALAEGAAPPLHWRSRPPPARPPALAAPAASTSPPDPAAPAAHPASEAAAPTMTAERVNLTADPSTASASALSSPSPPEPEPDLLDLIARLRTLRDAEGLLALEGRRFAPPHAAALLGALPALDRRGSNAGVRVRELLRLLTQGTLYGVEDVTGPALARCVASYAALSYAPSEAVPQICTALLAYYSRKLRSCGGQDLADLAWGLATLEGVYGDMHQAIKRPSYTAKLAPGARIVGRVRAVPAPDGASGGADAAKALTAGAQGDEGSSLGVDGEGKVEERQGKEGQAAAGAGAGAGAGTGAVSQGAPAPATRGEAGAGAGKLTAVGKRPKRVQDEIWMVPVAMAKIWERLAAAAGSKAAAGQLEGEQLAKLAWAYTRVGQRDEQLFDSLAAAAFDLLQPFLERAAAAADSAAAAAGSSRAGASAAAAAVNAAILAGGPAPFDAATVTYLAWSFVESGYGVRHRALLAALAAVAAPYKGEYRNDQIASLARSYAAAGHYDPELCAAFAMVASRRMAHLSGAQAAALLGSLAALRHAHEGLGPELARAARSGALKPAPQEAAELLWAVAQLGLDRPAPADGAALGLGVGTTAADPAAASAATSRRRPRSRRARAPAHPSAAAPLVRALQGHCGELTPRDVARSLWATGVLVRDLLASGDGAAAAALAEELAAAAARFPEEAYGSDDLLGLYGGAQLIGEMKGALEAARRVAAVAADGPGAAATAAAAARAADGEGGRVSGGWTDSDSGTDADEADGDAWAGDGRSPPTRPSSPGMRPADSQSRERLFAVPAAAIGGRSAARSRGYTTAAAGPGASEVPGEGAGDTASAAAAAAEGAAPWGVATEPSRGVGRDRRETGRRQGQRHGVDRDPKYEDPLDSSWSDVDWDSIVVPPPSAAAAAASGANVDTVGAHDVSVRKVYDEAAGRELWEVVDDGRADRRAGATAGGDDGADEDPAAALLPPALLVACQQAADGWAAAEAARLEAAEAGDAELWRLEVAVALRDLTGSDPLPRWRPPRAPALADLLLLPPAAAEPGGRAPPPVALLLLGPEAATRNPPYLPLGSTRARQALLEATGLRVVRLPRFLWRMAGQTPEEQACLLASLLGPMRR